MNRRRMIALAAVWSVLMGIVLTGRAFDRFRRPFPLWMTDAPQWYDDALGTAMYAVVATACVVYLYRRWRDDWQMAVSEVPLRPVRWRDKVELRVVLYCLAVLLALQLPLGIVQAIRALNDHLPPWSSSFLSLFPVGGWIFPLIAVAILVYDRRRIRRDRKDSGECLTCGYDLRATPERCPECGTPVPQVGCPD
jgi:hypothetical protein